MRTTALDRSRILQFTDDIFGPSLHDKRVFSLANAATGCLERASLAIHAIGLGLATACSLKSKHAIKQVDRLIGNRGLEVPILLATWVAFCVAKRPKIVVTLDWTEFDADGHSTLALNMVTRHGRATPLMWKTVLKADLKGKRNSYEDELLGNFKEALPAGTDVTVLADRGFGDIKLYEYLRELGFGFIIRFRENIHVRCGEETREARAWLSPSGRSKRLKNAKVTAGEYPLGSVVVTHAKGMKDAWCLAVSDPDMSAAVAIAAYQKRFTTEENFRDTKDPHFGMGLSQLRITRTDRRDRLLLVSALSVAFLTLLGAAGESTGLDMHFKANTVKTRTHSLFRQGCMYHSALPTMRDEWLSPLLMEFEKILSGHRLVEEAFSYI